MIEVTPPNSSQKVRRGNLSGWPVDGMLVWTNPWQVLQTNEHQSFAGPLVYLGHAREDETNWLTFDLYRGGRMIAEHIYDRGYRKAWYVTPFPSKLSMLSDDRVRAFVEVSAERGLEGRIVPMPADTVTRENGMEMAAIIAALTPSERPDAVICHNDLIAIGVFYGLRRAGLRVPEDIAVTGFDGLPEGQCFDRRLTTVVASAAQMARESVKILLDQIDGEERGLIKRIIPVQMILGETS
jgi:LacI family transcriptional regulator